MACPCNDHRSKLIQEPESTGVKSLTWLKDSSTQGMATLKEFFSQKKAALKTTVIWNRVPVMPRFSAKRLLTLTIVVLVPIIMALLFLDVFVAALRECGLIKSTWLPEGAKGQDLVDRATHFAHDSFSSVPEKAEGLKANMMAQGRDTLRAIRGQGRSIWDPMTHKVDVFRGVVKQVFMACLESSFKFAMCLIVALAAMVGSMILISNTGTKRGDESKGEDMPPTANGCVQGCSTYEEWLSKSKVDESE